MRFKQFMARWQGIFLSLVGSIAVLWLGASKRLNLYIHPRYITFTVILALIATAIAFASFMRSYTPEIIQKTKYQKLASIGAVVLCTTAVFGLLVIKPATLTTSAVNQRGMNSGIGAGIKTTNAIPLFSGGDFDSFTIKDWSSLLVQTSDISFYAGKSATIIGFVSPDPDDSKNVFFVSRFVVTCCAVDARPIGVPVYLPDWQSRFKADDWVKATGKFIVNPSTKSQQHIVIQPDSLLPTTEPQEPYVY